MIIKSKEVVVSNIHDIDTDMLIYINNLVNKILTEFIGFNFKVIDEGAIIITINYVEHNMHKIDKCVKELNNYFSNIANIEYSKIS